MDVIAEGIETPQHLLKLRSLQCEYGQGYWFSKLLDKGAAEELLAAQLQNNKQSPPLFRVRCSVILEWVAQKKGKQVIYIDPWYPSSKTCSECGHVLNKLDLSIRRWRCPSCNSVNDRDENAAINICMVGSSTLGVGDVRQPYCCNLCLMPESHALLAVGVAQKIVS